MGIFDIFDSEKKIAKEKAIKAAEQNEMYEAEVEKLASFSFSPIFTYSYDGEKTPGEIGIIKNYLIDYPALRARSWQSYIESEVTQTIINKFITWIIGSGLKLQSEPIKEILSANKDAEEGILRISTRGLAYVHFKSEDYTSDYYLTELEKAI